MNQEETREIAKSMFGDELYQQRARRAFPILVRQAKQHQPIFYQELAAELEMPNPRNLNFVLGSIGTTLQELSRKKDWEIPKIQALVVNVDTKQPGPGFFGGEDAFKQLPRWKRNSQVAALYGDIFAYSDWDEVLKELGLFPLSVTAKKLIAAAAEFHGGGESDAHRQMKEAIASDPTLIDLPARCHCLGMEYRLPSGDALDVFLEYGRKRIAVEVKTSISDLADVTRGLFQCVKYQAVIDALAAYENWGTTLEIILALESKLPAELVPLRNALQVRVVDGVDYRSGEG